MILSRARGGRTADVHAATWSLQTRMAAAPQSEKAAAWMSIAVESAAVGGQAIGEAIEGYAVIEKTKRLGAVRQLQFVPPWPWPGRAPDDWPTHGLMYRGFDTYSKMNDDDQSDIYHAHFAEHKRLQRALQIVCLKIKREGAAIAVIPQLRRVADTAGRERLLVSGAFTDRTDVRQYAILPRLEAMQPNAGSSGGQRGRTLYSHRCATVV